MNTSEASVRLTVDRREGKLFLLMGEDGKSFDVSAKELPPECKKEGAVLDVPVGPESQPLWRRAVRNHAEEARLLRDAASRLERLRRTDPGGDVDL